MQSRRRVEDGGVPGTTGGTARRSPRSRQQGGSTLLFFHLMPKVGTSFGCPRLFPSLALVISWLVYHASPYHSSTEARSISRLPFATTTFSSQSAGNRGYVLQLCNAIRLQADTMPPTEFLRNYLNSHEQWRNFVETLREATLEQQTPGLGFEVSDTWHADKRIYMPSPVGIPPCPMAFKVTR